MVKAMFMHCGSLNGERKIRDPFKSIGKLEKKDSQLCQSYELALSPLEYSDPMKL